MPVIEVRPASWGSELRRELRCVRWPKDAPALLVTPRFGPRTLGRFARQHQGREWMAARIHKNEVWCFFSGSGCWQCLTDWLSLRDWPVARPGPAWGRRASMWMRSQLDAQRPDGLRVGDLASGLATDHVIVRRPQCAVCGDPNLQGVRQGIPRESEAAKVQRLERYVSPVTGFLGSLRVYQLAGVHLAEAEFLNPGQKPAWAVGLGTTKLQAKLRCLGEAAERYSLGWQGHERAVERSWEDLGDERCESELLWPFSDRQYADRDNWNGGEWGFPWITAKLGRREVTRWSEAHSLVTGAKKLVPAEMVYFGARTRSKYFVSDTIGCAAGSSWEGAVLRGLFEWIERDAVAIWWYNRLKRPSVELDSHANRRAVPWLQFLKGCGRPFWVLDLTTDLGVPVAAAISESTRGSHVAMGFGCDWDMELAFAKALRELCQVTKGIENCRFESLPRNSMERAFGRWSSRAAASKEPHLAPWERERRIPSSGSAGQRVVTVEAVVSRLSQAGVEPLAVGYWRPEIDFPVARVLAPGLCHPWHRLGIRRLYEAPVRMGLLKQSKAEAKLNPVPFVQ